MADYDVIVVGAGHNGLVCALYLAHAGMRVAVLERSKSVGGAVRSGEVTLPGFNNDLFATNMSLFVVSPVYREFRKEFDDAGLRLLTNGYPFASSYTNGRTARVYTDPSAMEREMAGHSSADLAGWQEALGLYKRTASAFLPLFHTTLPSVDMVRHLSHLLRRPKDRCGLFAFCHNRPGSLLMTIFARQRSKASLRPGRFTLIAHRMWRLAHHSLMCRPSQRICAALSLPRAAPDASLRLSEP